MNLLSCKAIYLLSLPNLDGLCCAYSWVVLVAAAELHMELEEDEDESCFDYWSVLLTLPSEDYLLR